MTDFDYKKYSLENLENWMHDAMSAGEASPEEIYDVIIGVVKDNYYTYKHQASQAYELLALLNGNGMKHLSCDKDDKSPECVKHWDEFWETPYNQTVKDKVVKWQLPVEVDSCNGEYFITFPDDLLEATNLKEGDQVEWVDIGDGSYLLRKVAVNDTLKMEEC